MYDIGVITLEHEFVKRSIRLPQDLIEKINIVAAQRGDNNFSEAARYLLERGLSLHMMDANVDDLTAAIRQSLDVVLKPHVDRLAAISAKGVIAGSTAQYLMMQYLHDLYTEIAPELAERTDLRKLINEARLKAVQDLRKRLDETDLTEN